MLIVKLKEPVKKLYPGEGLETVEVEAEYLAAATVDYSLGDEKVTFYFKIGKVDFDEENNPIDFHRVIKGSVILDEEELKDWGLDDIKALEAIAKKLGVEIVEHFRLDTDLMFKS